MRILTNNYKKPLGDYKLYIPNIEKWVKETNPDLTNLTFNEAWELSAAHKYNKVEKNSPEEVKRNMNTFFANTQNISPQAPNFAVDIRIKSKSIPANIKSKINKAIYNLGNFHIEIPLKTIFTICEQNGVVPLQEDGTYWNGMIIGGADCGSNEAKEQIAHFDMAFKADNEYVPSNNMLSLSWCKMPSGKYEIVCYIS